MRGAKEKKIKKRDKDTHTTTTTTLACTGGMGPLELLRSGLNPAKQLEVGLCPTGLQCTGRKGCSEHLHLAGTVSRNSHEEWRRCKPPKSVQKVLPRLDYTLSCEGVLVGSWQLLTKRCKGKGKSWVSLGGFGEPGNSHIKLGVRLVYPPLCSAVFLVWKGVCVLCI